MPAFRWQARVRGAYSAAMTAATLPVPLTSSAFAPRDAVALRRVDAFGGMDVMRATYVAHSFPPHFHTTFAIGVMTHGACALECRGTTYLLRAGHVVLLAPGEVHTGEQISADGWSNRVLYPEPAMLAAAAGDRVAGGTVRFRSPVIDDPSASARLVRLHRMLEASACPMEQESRTLDVLRDLVVAYGDDRTVPPVRRHWPAMSAARDYLHAHCAEAVSLTTLAAVAGLSCFYFLRLFRVTFGVTPHVYLALLRLERARALMRTAAPLAQTAVAAGFSDQSHLTRFFKRVYGITPGVYARAVRV